MDRDDPGQEPAAEEPRVGYGRPPLHSRFQPGRSGNPKGRPRKRRKLEDVLQEVLGEKMWGTVNGKRRRVTVETAILLRLREQALKGDQKAAAFLLNLRRGSQSDESAAITQDVLSMEDRQILAQAGLLKLEGAGDDSA